MRQLRDLACLVIAGISFTVPLRAQTRPNFVGKWTLVVEKSVPATPESHGREITITQEAQTITLTQIGFRVSGSSSSTIRDREEFVYSLTYDFDGAEHPTPTPSPMPPTTPTPVPPPGATVMSMGPADSRYRAIWTRDQLVIMTRTTIQRTPAPPGYVPPKRVSRKALSLDADGLLVVDSITVTDPTPGGASQPAPTPVRSVYRKAS